MTDWLDELDKLEREATPGADTIEFRDALHNHARELIDMAKRDDQVQKNIADTLQELYDLEAELGAADEENKKLRKEMAKAQESNRPGAVNIRAGDGAPGSKGGSVIINGLIKGGDAK